MNKETTLTNMIAVGRISSRWRRAGRLGVLVVLAVLVAVALEVSTAPAVAAAPGVAWAVQAAAQPSNFQSADTNDQYTLSFTNVGSESSSGAITVTDTLPAGITTSATPRSEEEGEGGVWACAPGAGQSVVTCTLAAPVRALTQTPAIFVPVSVSPSASGTPVNQVQIAGGGSPECGGAGQPACASASTPTSISPQTIPFDLLDFSAEVWDAGGGLDTQAGGHPWGLTTTFDLPSVNNIFGTLDALPVENVRQVVVDLPAGLVGNPQAAPKCLLSDLANFGACAPATRVATIGLIKPPASQGGAETNVPVYNVVPEHGYPAEFGIVEPRLKRFVLLYASVRSGSDYGVRVTLAPLPRAAVISGISTTFFGNPALRDGSPNAPLAFFSNPTDCSGVPLTVTVHVDSWQHPGAFNTDGTPDFSDPNWKGATATLPPVGGCEALRFDPMISMLPDTPQAGSPAGYNFDLSVPQNSDPNGLATAHLKDATVVLPAGVAVSPSAGDGLQGCSDAQIALSSGVPGSCPLESQVGTVQITTPLLPNPLVGQVFLGTPNCAPCTDADAQGGRMLRLFIQAQGSGVVVKLAGSVSVDPGTGQLTAVFKNNPQVPFSDLQLQFKGGPRAPLANPTSCGTYTTMSDLVPWSSPFTVDGTQSSSFEVTGCGNLGLFAPSFVAGTVSPQAGGFSPFSVSFSRSDQDQDLGGVTVQAPPGLLGMLSRVSLCGEPQASQGTCGAGSLIGHVTTGAGPGSHPFYLGGQVFLTGPYRGAPFGLSIVVPAVAGPLNLGNVVVRAAISVDPHTAQITVVSDTLPRILRGIPLRIKTVNVTIDREGFMFNPTSCNPMSVGGTLTSTQGATVQVSSRFQAAGCAALGFRPSFTVSSQAKTSKAQGASLDVMIGYPSGAQANIHSVAVSLPRQLPSRLTTIQQACPEGVFDANPASCPVGSLIGMATARTPVLSNPVVGPVYLVSHGGAAFPDVVMILQGEGVTVDLVGSIYIKHGVTSSTFANVPDVPISSFDLTLPEGPHSALTVNLPAKAKGSLCGQSLTMPTTITGQNGAVVRQSTKIKVTGCPKAKKKHRAKAHRKARQKKGK